MSPYEVAGRRQDGLRRRDQEGLPQARPREPPGRQPGRRAPPRSGSRRSRAPTTLLSDPEKRKQYDAFGANGARRLRRGGRPGPGRFSYENVDLVRPARPVRRHLRPRWRRCPAARSRSAAPISSRTCGSRSRTRSPARRCACRSRSRPPATSATARGAEPGTSPVTCPRVRRLRDRLGLHGLFALSQPCPRCRGNGVIVEKPCKNCRGSGSRAGDAALRRQDPGRARRTARGCGSRARASRAQRRACRRPLRRRRRRAVAAVRAPRLGPRARRARSPIPRRRSAQPSRSRRRTARWR